MKAVVAHAFGAPESFVIEEVTDPVPGPGDVVVRVQVAAVNFVDVLVAGGAYQVKPPLPFTPGGEFSGTVEAIGPGVETLKIGDKVCGSSAGGGAFGELAKIRAVVTFKVPEAMSFVDAATFRVSNATAYHALVQRGRLQAGETVLVLGAGGAVGYAAIQIAKALGARVVGSASLANQAVALQAGADAVVDSRAEDWRDQVKAAAGGPIDVVVDPIGGDTTEKAFRNLGWGGRHLVIGFAAGDIPRLPINLALVKGASLVGVDVRQFSLLEPEASAANMRALFDLYEAGKLPVPPVRLYPLSRFAEAMTEVKNGVGVGRALLQVAG